jgi:hypothetical protein
MHEHVPEVQHVTPTASHSANIQLCCYLPERRWDQLPARNPGFVGRGELLTQMDDRCFGDACVGSSGLCVSLVLTNALTGSGGVGKSQSANEFAHRNLEARKKICGNTSLVNSFVPLLLFFPEILWFLPLGGG